MGGVYWGTPRNLIDVRSDARDFTMKGLPGTRMAGIKIHGFDTQTLLYRDKQGNPKNVDRGYHSLYLGHIPAFAKHVKGMPIEISEDSGLSFDVKHFSMTTLIARSTKLRFSTSLAGYAKLTKPALTPPCRMWSKKTDLYRYWETELEAWKTTCSPYLCFSSLLWHTCLSLQETIYWFCF